MKLIKIILRSFTKQELLISGLLLVVMAASIFVRGALAFRENTSYLPTVGGVFREGETSQPIAINPIISENQADLDISALVYSPLDELISSVEVGSEGREYSVKLKENLKWSDGEPLTSDDVKFTVETIQSPEVKSPLSKTWQGIITERVSELKVKFTLPSPYAFFENNLKRLRIIPKHIFGAVPAANLWLSNYNIEPVGSGPYKFESFNKKKNGFITDYNLTINQNYAGPQPYVKNFTFRFYPSEQKLIEAFKRREIDGFGALAPLDFETKDLKAQVRTIAMPRYYAVFYNPKSTSWLKNKEFRSILDEAIDKQKLAETATGKWGQPIAGPDLEPAKTSSVDIVNLTSRLAKLNKDDEPISITITIPDVPFIKKTAEFIKNSWLAIGVPDVKIKSLDRNEFFTEVIRERNYEAVIFGNVLENALDLFPFWHSSQRFYPNLNLSFYDNKTADNLMEEIRHASDKSKRQELFKELVSTIKDSKPATFLYTLPYVYLTSDALKGFQIKNNQILMPADRFNQISSWYVKEVRVWNKNENKPKQPLN